MSKFKKAKVVMLPSNEKVINTKEIMKEFNEKHNAIINSNETPSIANPKNGEICNHFEKVDYIEFYHPISEKKFIQVKLKRDFILDLAEQIKNIESVIFETEYVEDFF